MVNCCVRDKKPCLLNNTGQLKKWLSRQLALSGSWHNNCVLSQTRVDLRLRFLSTRYRQGRWCLPFFMAIGIGIYLLATLFVRIQFAPNHFKRRLGAKDVSTKSSLQGKGYVAVWSRKRSRRLAKGLCLGLSGRHPAGSEHLR